MTIEAVEPDTIIVRRAQDRLDEAFGVFDGLYEPGWLDRLRVSEHG